MSNLQLLIVIFWIIYVGAINFLKLKTIEAKMDKLKEQKNG